jgi:hypothetical protein
MKKALSVIFVCLTLLCGSVEAKPWYRDWKSWAVIGAAVGSHIALEKTTHDCRIRSDIGRCYGEYSGQKAIQGLDLGATVGFLALSLEGRHLGFKEWVAPVAGITLFNSIQAYHQTVAPPKAK